MRIAGVVVRYAPVPVSLRRGEGLDVEAFIGCLARTESQFEQAIRRSGWV